MPPLRLSTALAAAVALTGVGLLLPAAATAAAAAPDLAEIRTFAVADPQATGYSADLDGDLAVYSGRYRSTSAAGTGLVQVAHRTGPADTDWTTTDLPVPADSRGFGVAVAVDEAAGRVVVGALASQQVVVYTRTGTDAWEVAQVLTPPADARVGLVRNFGESVALDGGTLVVGAPNSTVDGRANAGAAYVFDLGTGTGTALLPAADQVVANAIAGQSVAAGGGRIAVGAPQLRQALAFYGGEYRVGGVYLWDAGDLAAGPSLTTQPVGEDIKAVPPSATGGGAAFGFDLAIVGTRLYVGSPLEVNYTADDPADTVGGVNASSIDAGTSTQGAVYAYDTTDAQAPARIGGKLMPPERSWGFGYQVDATEDVLLASAYRSDDDGRGEVHVLDPHAIDPATPDDGGLLRQTVAPAQTLRGSDMEPGARFGSSIIGGDVAVSGSRAIVSAFATGASASGKVYLFEPVGAAPAEPVEVSAPDVTITYGEEATLTATVAGLEPAGATIRVDGIDVPGATVTGSTVGVDLPAAAHPAGDHEVTVAVHPAIDAETAATATATLRVLPAPTVTSLRPDGEPGDVLPVGGEVVAAYGTVPTGPVEILAGGEVVATADVSPSGTFTADVPTAAAAPGTLALEARYAGDGNHLASAGTAAVTVPGLDPPVPGPEPTTDPTAEPTTPPTDRPTPPADDPTPPAGTTTTRSQVLATTGPGGIAALVAAAAAVIATGGALLARRSRVRAVAVRR